MSTKIKTSNGWKEVGNIGVSDKRNPDWDAYTSTSISIKNSSYTATKDGIAFVSVRATDNFSLFVNNKIVYQYSGYGLCAACIPARKGDVFTSSGSISEAILRFCPYTPL